MADEPRGFSFKRRSNAAASANRHATGIERGFIQVVDGPPRASAGAGSAGAAGGGGTAAVTVPSNALPASITTTSLATAAGSSCSIKPPFSRVTAPNSGHETPLGGNSFASDRTPKQHPQSASGGGGAGSTLNVSFGGRVNSGKANTAAVAPHSSLPMPLLSSAAASGGAAATNCPTRRRLPSRVAQVWTSLLRRRRHLKRRLCLAAVVLLVLLVVYRWWTNGGEDAGHDAAGLAVTPEELLEKDEAAAAAAALAGLDDTLLVLENMGPQEELSGDHSTWSTLIQHEDALARLNFTPAQQACLADLSATCEIGQAHLSRLSLPSWTLSRMQLTCPDCIVRRTDAKVLEGKHLSAHYAVAATQAAPLGHVGPMLFAMSSVTNDINVQQELPKWSWMRHVYDDFPTIREEADEDTTTEAAKRKKKVPRPYLAVMGVPSTDQPARVALRTAQRQTWMTYQEIARSENNFNGALLPLYLFAAVEPSAETAADNVQEANVLNEGEEVAEEEVEETEKVDEASPTTTTTTTTTTTSTTTTTTAAVEAAAAAAAAARASAQLCSHTDLLLPTVREYQRGSLVLAKGNTAAAPNQKGNTQDQPDETQPPQEGHDKHNGPDTFVQRRIVLRANFRTTDLAASPCSGVAATHVSAAAAPDLPLGHLSKRVGLNVTPSFVSPAEYICCASAGLWGEALTHRNVIWIDMMTDRKPTTKKQLGDTSKWGLPVEVGMSQKLILWLLYAHSTFTNVPFIMKGDDDMYLKVPQFLNDVRFLRRGRKKGRSSPPPLQQQQQQTQEVDPNSATDNGGHVTVDENQQNHNKKAMASYENPDDVVPLNETRCFYWGSTRRMGQRYFNAGMLFMLQRNLVTTILERPRSTEGEADLLELAARNFSQKLARVYRRAKFNAEDVMIGHFLRLRRARVAELCPEHHTTYVRESNSRYHDLRKGRTHAVTWKSVVVHRCKPADTYFLHYFFQHELPFASADVPPNEGHEAVARETAAAWVAQTREALPSDVLDWDALPETTWYHNVKKGAAYVVAQNDGVPVYNIAYKNWNDEKFHVVQSFRSPK